MKKSRKDFDLLNLSNKIFLSGGLGNQLFQISFAHYLRQLSNLNSEVIKYNENSKIQHTNISFIENNNNCGHCNYTVYSGLPFVTRLVNPWNHNYQSRFRGKFVDLRETPFLDPTPLIEINSPRKWIGYFQNSNIVKSVENIMRNEISIRVESKTLNIDIPKIDYELIHIRQGDTNTPANRLRVGVLDQYYYEKLLSFDSSSLRIVVTDDPAGASKILKRIRYDEIFAPKDLNVYGTLKFMSNAKRLVTANSTLSWWGGFLAVDKGAKVVIPRPFFRSENLYTNEGLNYPGFNTAEASFM